MADLAYRDTYRKQIGNLLIEAPGGGYPRWTRIVRTDRDDMEITGLSSEEVRDLHYALGCLLGLTETSKC